ALSLLSMYRSRCALSPLLIDLPDLLLPERLPRHMGCAGYALQIGALSCPFLWSSFFTLLVQQGRLNLVLYYVHRIWRLTPVYAFMIMIFMNLEQYFGYVRARSVLRAIYQRSSD